MERRQFLRFCSFAAVGTLAGCTGNSEDDGTPTPMGTSEDWTRQTKLTSDNAHSADQFGWSVAVSSDDTTAIIGAVGDENPDGGDTGAAYVFDSSGGSWSQQAKLVADDGTSEDAFGKSVAVSSDGTTTLIGAAGEEDSNSGDVGSAYVFKTSDDSWSQQAKLTTDDGDSKDKFGRSVAMSGDGTTALIGAEKKLDMNSKGGDKAYIFKSSDGSWSQQTSLPIDDDEGDRFGGSVAVSGDGTTSLIGDPEGHIEQVGPVGSAYVFFLIWAVLAMFGVQL